MQFQLLWSLSRSAPTSAIPFVYHDRAFFACAGSRITIVSFGKVRNQHGEFVEASLESIALAASGEIRDDSKMSLVNAKRGGGIPDCVIHVAD